MAGIITATTPVGMAMRFTVEVDGTNLGSWATCKGLSLEFKTLKQGSGGFYDHPTLLIDKGFPTYKPIVLERAVTKDGQKALWEWLVKFTSQYDAFKKSAACIRLMDHTNKEVTKWELQGVFPTKWEGPALDGAGKKIAIEKLTFEHEGFLSAGGITVNLALK